MRNPIQQQLARDAKEQGLSGTKRDSFVFGSMQEGKWMPDREKRRKRQADAFVTALRSVKE